MIACLYHSSVEETKSLQPDCDHGYENMFIFVWLPIAYAIHIFIVLRSTFHIETKSPFSLYLLYTKITILSKNVRKHWPNDLYSIDLPLACNKRSPLGQTKCAA